MTRAGTQPGAEPQRGPPAPAAPELGLGAEQEGLRADARALVAELPESELLRAFGARGWLALGVPRAAGGSGGGLLELALLSLELGRRARSLPLRTSAIECGGLLLELGSDAQRRAWLPEIWSGRRFLCFVPASDPVSGSADGAGLRAERVAAGFALRGSASFVENAAAASGFVVAAAGDALRAGAAAEPALFLVEAERAGLRLEALSTLSPAAECALHFDGVALPESARLGSGAAPAPALERLRLRSRVALCAELAGGARAALELAVEHVQRRVQWERPIASFQAVQHALADALIDADAAELACFEAAACADAGLPFEALARSASVVCAEACLRNARRAHQLLGGAGYLAASELPLHYRRAVALAEKLGGSERQRQALARELGL